MFESYSSIIVNSFAVSTYEHDDWSIMVNITIN